ncbi:P-II family nitrogen regulator [Aerococcus kribbianus]|uniref:P-II family nitrogen regulator n=1 Tax=Aerococcus kribbianus TaxID=2999064 RepID=A0A9X3FN11_9LACT|nr:MULTISPECIES: P-II family nitrogen regulator [unclassified Aerococcus]MCZ0716768.1 P-II family nitrogen regulator [Aerococcus sp. YH-aer221]MCZ0725056.1 P-II family nitrogen regulator [Aerococcus sp. YH-aer222]
MQYPVVLLGILKDGQGSKMLTASKEGGSTGGIVIRAQGTLSNKIMNMLGLHDRKKEMFFTLIPKDMEDKMHHYLDERMNMSKKGHGVLFSLDTSSVIGNHGQDYEYEESESNMTGHQLIVTIVDREFGDDVVQASREAGAHGATILHGRGTGTGEFSKLFNAHIEPEKEVVVMVVDGDKCKQISDKIVEELDIRAQGKGLLFSVNVSQATGLFEADE